MESSSTNDNAPSTTSNAMDLERQRAMSIAGVMNIGVVRNSGRAMSIAGFSNVNNGSVGSSDVMDFAAVGSHNIISLGNIIMGGLDNVNGGADNGGTVSTSSDVTSRNVDGLPVGSSAANDNTVTSSSSAGSFIGGLSGVSSSNVENQPSTSSGVTSSVGGTSSQSANLGASNNARAQHLRNVIAGMRITCEGLYYPEDFEPPFPNFVRCYNSANQPFYSSWLPDTSDSEIPANVDRDDPFGSHLDGRSFHMRLCHAGIIGPQMRIQHYRVAMYMENNLITSPSGYNIELLLQQRALNRGRNGPPVSEYYGIEGNDRDKLEIEKALEPYETPEQKLIRQIQGSCGIIEEPGQFYSMYDGHYRHEKWDKNHPKKHKILLFKRFQYEQYYQQ